MITTQEHSKYTYVDGKLVISGEEASLAPCLYYESASETLRSYATHNGIHIFQAEAHLKRLKTYCQELNIPFEWDIHQLIKDLHFFVESNKHKTSIIQINVSVPVSYQFKRQSKSTITFKSWPYSATKINNQQKVNLIIAPANLPLRYAKASKYLPLLWELKHNAEKNGYHQSILIDAQDSSLIQAIQGPIFIEKNSTLYTPKHSAVGIAITKNVIGSICKKLDIEVIEKPLFANDLLEADSAFIVSTETEISGIKTIEQHKLPYQWHESIGANLSISYKHLALERENYEVII